MLFNSLQFLIFFPAVTLLFFLLPKNMKWSLLLTASCIFYMAFVPYYILILLFTITVDYVSGIKMEQIQNPRQRKRWFLASIFANIGCLAFFKYFNFLNENVTGVLGWFNLENPVPALHIILPIGLSFHTFQSLSYIVEVYRGNYKAEKSFGMFALYVMFYPQLVAGPIERPHHVLPQLHAFKKFDAVNAMNGITLMLWGFVKKVVIADRLSIYADHVFDDPSSFSSWNLLLAVYFFSFQIYCDFSGYTDIAIGAAKVMGIDLMQNFNRPYFAQSIRDFWSRWHLSLTTWFRDYVYIPLGGNRISFGRTCLNISIVFLLSGLWHGANWTFVIWGAIHMVCMIIQLLLERFGIAGIPKKNFVSVLARRFLVFNMVSLAWIFFRAHSVNHAFEFLQCLFHTGIQGSFIISHDFFGGFSLVLSLLLIVLLMFTEFFTSYDLHEITQKPACRILFSAACIILIISLGVFSGQTFIYFQF